MDSSTVMMLNETICHFWGFRSILSLLFYFLWKTLLANKVDPDQTPHVASDLGLQCLPMTLLQISQALRKAKILCNFGLSECKRVSHKWVAFYYDMTELPMKRL